MDNQNAGFTVKDENIIGFNVIEKNPDFDPDALDPGERKTLEAKNAMFMEKVIRTRLLPMANPCACQRYEIMRRAMMSRPRIMAGSEIRNPPSPQVLQKDIDAKKFSLVVDDVDGRHCSLRVVIAQCSRCGKTEISGDLGVIGSIFANGVLDFANANPGVYWESVSGEAKREEGIGDYSLVDVETGDRNEISSLGDLVGGSAGGEVRTEDT